MATDPSSGRTYNQFCALARSLDVLGKRWTLLIIRELLSGPKRYTDLQEGLPGIGTNLLSSRLKMLQQQSVIEQTTLPPPAASDVYRLTEKGEALRPVIRELQKWGLGMLEEPGEEDYFHPRWALSGMLAAFVPERAEGIHRVYEFHIEDEIFHITVDDGTIDGEQGAAEAPDVIIDQDAETFLDLATQSLDPQQALESGRVELRGDLEDQDVLEGFEEFLSFFELPAYTENR